MRWKLEEITKQERERGRRVWIERKMQIREDADRRKMLEMG